MKKRLPKQVKGMISFWKGEDLHVIPFTSFSHIVFHEGDAIIHMLNVPNIELEWYDAEPLQVYLQRRMK